MQGPNLPSAIPAPTADDKPFQIGDELTVYEAAMVYAGRHPYPKFFGLNGRSSKCERLLTYLNLKRPWSQLARDIFYELGERIKRDRVKPIKPAYTAGDIDLFRTVISIDHVVQLANDRGEKPKYLRPLLEAADDRVPALTSNDELRAVDYIAPKLQENPHIKRDVAREMLGTKFSTLSGRGFDERVWPNARARAGLPAAAPPGPKPKSNQTPTRQNRRT